MIANITSIMCILSVSDKSINNGILQKGTAISRIDNDGGYQIYKFYCYLPDSDEDSSESADSEVIQPLKEENVYLITGKFSITHDCTLYITVTTNVSLPIDKEDIPISKPTVHLLGKTQTYADLTEIGYNLQVQVKPYLSKDHFYTFTVNFTHPVNGRFKNALTKAKKNSTVYGTGILFIANNKLYCEILDFQFVTATKTEIDGGITVPWKLNNDPSAEKTSSFKPKSAIEQRIALVRQNDTVAAQPSSNDLTTRKRKTKLPVTRLSNLSKSLIQNDDEQQEQIVEVITIDDDEQRETTGENPDNEPHSENKSKKTRKRGRKSKKN